MSAISRVIRATITVAVVLAGFTSTPSEAQWAWKDGNGRLVYSDRPPPSDVKPASIVRQPTQQMLPNSAPVIGQLTMRANRLTLRIPTRRLRFQRTQNHRRARHGIPQAPAGARRKRQESGRRANEERCQDGRVRAGAWLHEVARRRCAHPKNRRRRQSRISGRRAACRRSRSHAQDYSKRLQLGPGASSCAADRRLCVRPRSLRARPPRGHAMSLGRPGAHRVGDALPSDQSSAGDRFRRDRHPSAAGRVNTGAPRFRRRSGLSTPACAREAAPLRLRPARSNRAATLPR